MFTKEELLAAKVARESVPVKVNGKTGTVWVRGMTGTERDSWEQTVFAKRKGAKDEVYPYYRASLIVRSVCDDKGARLFSDEDIVRVSEMPADILDDIYDVAARLSGISQEEVDRIEKNSMTDQSQSSS